MTQNAAKSFQNRVFMQTLAGLSPSETKAFLSFCQQSPTLSGPAKKLVTLIQKAHPHWERLQEAQILRSCFSDDAKGKKQLNYALNHLFERLQNWLIQKELADDDDLQNQLFIRACKKRFIHSQFFKKTQQTLNTLETNHLPVPETWHRQFETNFQLFYHVQTPKNQAVVESLVDMETHLDRFYYGSKIRLLCQKIVRQRTFPASIELDPATTNTILTYAENHQQALPYFKLYTQLIRHLQHPTSETLNAFFNQFQQDSQQLQRLDQSMLLYIASNSLNKPTMEGDKTTSQTQFKLLSYAFEKELMIFDNQLSPGPFNNFMIAACEIGEFKIAQQVLKKSHSYFPPSIQEEFHNLMQCTLYYYLKQYEKVEVNLYNFKFKSPMLRVRSRNLLIKSLYEQYQKNSTLQPTLLARLTQFRKYIQKQNKIPETRKPLYYNLIKVLRKLTQSVHQRPRQRAKVQEELMQFIADPTNKMISLDWLREKIRQLEIPR